MMPAARLVQALAAAALLTTSASPSAECCKTVPTDFGYVRVPARDVATAEKIGDAVRRAANGVLRVRDARFAIVDANHTKYHWGNTTPDGLPVYPWSFVHGADYVAVQPPDGVLRHEIGHDLFRRYVVPDTHPNQYGTDAPDWLDEAVAIAFEAPEDQAERRCEAARLSREHGLIPLDRYLKMTQPDLASIQQHSTSGSPTTKFVYAASASNDTPAFYAMSIAFPEYLAARLGSASALPDVIDAFRTGHRLDEWILRKVGGSREFRMPDLEADFASWLAQDPRYQCSGQVG